MRRLLLTSVLFAATTLPVLAYTPGQYVDDMWIDEGEKIVALSPSLGSPLVITGWTRRGRGDVYRVTVKAGDRLFVGVESKSEFLMLAVFDFATPDDEAIFFSEADNRKTVLSIKNDTELLIRPILILGQPRRGLGANYQLTLERRAE